MCVWYRRGVPLYSFSNEGCRAVSPGDPLTHAQSTWPPSLAAGKDWQMNVRVRCGGHERRVLCHVPIVHHHWRVRLLYVWQFSKGCCHFQPANGASAHTLALSKTFCTVAFESSLAFMCDLSTTCDAGAVGDVMCVIVACESDCQVCVDAGASRSCSNRCCGGNHCR